MMKYNVLWIDDEHQSLENFKDDARNSDIELIGYTNATDAITELELNHNFYDALILDGKFYNNPNQSGDDMDNTAFGKVALCLNNLKAKNIIIPWFILSGQPSFVKEKNEIVSVLADKTFANAKVFDKNKDEDFNELLNEIIKSSSEIEKTKLKLKYFDVFECFGDIYLSKVAQNHLLEVLLQIENNIWSSNSFIALRKVIEEIYKRLHEIDDELIPYACLRFENGKINFTYCILRLQGKEINGLAIKSISPVVPDHLGWLIQPLEKVCSIIGAHTDKEGKYVNIYSLKTVLFGVMEMIIWFKKYIDENYE